MFFHILPSIYLNGKEIDEGRESKKIKFKQRVTLGLYCFNRFSKINSM